MALILFAIFGAAILGADVWLIYLLKNNKKMLLSQKTISIDWAGSGYQYAPPRMTVNSTEDWLAVVAEQLKTTLTKMEKVAPTSVVLQPSESTPELSGKVVVDSIEYGYAVIGDSSMTLPDNFVF